MARKFSAKSSRAAASPLAVRTSHRGNIDTQGSELDVLSGASTIIENAKLIYCECPIIQYNLGSPNIQEYLNFFKKINFIPVAVLEHHYLENILVQIDIMFMNYNTKNQFLGPTENIRPFLI